MSAEENQPDWDQIAEKFDLWLPHLASVWEAMITALQAQEGHTVLDVASGTGEPALTLARRLAGKARIVGIDAAQGMTNAEDLYPPLPKVTSLGAPGVMESLFYAAGFADFRVEKKMLHYQFDSFDEYWDTVDASDILKQQYDALPEDQHDSIRDEVGQFARDFIQDGQLIIPHEYLLVSGNKRS